MQAEPTDPVAGADCRLVGPMLELADGAAANVAEARSRMIETLERTAATVRDVIGQNERLAKEAGHRESPLQRVREGRAELETLRREIENLRAGRPLGA